MKAVRADPKKRVLIQGARPGDSGTASTRCLERWNQNSACGWLSGFGVEDGTCLGCGLK